MTRDVEPKTHGPSAMRTKDAPEKNMQKKRMLDAPTFDIFHPTNRRRIQVQTGGTTIAFLGTTKSSKQTKDSSQKEMHPCNEWLFCV